MTIVNFLNFSDRSTISVFDGLSNILVSEDAEHTDAFVKYIQGYNG